MMSSDIWQSQQPMLHGEEGLDHFNAHMCHLEQVSALHAQQVGAEMQMRMQAIQQMQMIHAQASAVAATQQRSRPRKNRKGLRDRLRAKRRFAADGGGPQGLSFDSDTDDDVLGDLGHPAPAASSQGAGRASAAQAQALPALQSCDVSAASLTQSVVRMARGDAARDASVSGGDAGGDAGARQQGLPSPPGAAADVDGRLAASTCWKEACEASVKRAELAERRCARLEAEVSSAKDAQDAAVQRVEAAEGVLENVIKQLAAKEAERRTAVESAEHARQRADALSEELSAARAAWLLAGQSEDAAASNAEAAAHTRKVTSQQLATSSTGAAGCGQRGNVSSILMYLLVVGLLVASSPPSIRRG